MNILKKVAVLTALVVGVSPILPNVSSADYINLEEDSEIISIEFNTSVNDEVLTKKEEKEILEENLLSEEVLSDDFDLEEVVENNPSLHEMNNEEKELFYSIINEQVELAQITDLEEKEIYRNSLINFFNEESESFNNLEGLQNELEESIIEKLESEGEASPELLSFLENVTVSTFGVTLAHALSNPFKGKIRISVKAAGAVFNTAIGIAIEE